MDQINELIDNTASEFTEMDGIYGQKFTGRNGGTLFIPAAGYYDGFWEYPLRQLGKQAYYWASNIYVSEYNTFACGLYFHSSKIYSWGMNRSDGCSVRPVRAQ